jgi:trigger factor
MDDQLYQVGDPEETGQKLDRELLGTSAGGIVKFTDMFDGEDDRELNFTVIVKDVKTLKLPDADDDFAITASEFDTVEELRADLRGQLAAAKLDLARSALRGRAVETVSELVDVPLPRTLVDQEAQFQLARLARDAERRQIPFDRYLQAVGTTFEELQEQLRDNARKTVRAQLVVDRIGRDAGIEVTNDDLTREVTEEAARLNLPPQELAQFMSEPERLGMLVTDAFRRKTIDHILERVEIVDAPPAGAEASTPAAETDGEVAPADGHPSDVEAAVE